MHEGEVVATVEQVTALVHGQFPQWADLPVTAVPIGGSDHALFRIGDELVARMPRMDWALDQAGTDARWLPVLAPHLPVAVPVPIATGAPGEGYPHTWTVAPWITGDTPSAVPVDLTVLAEDLGGFVRALRTIDPTGGPPKTGEDRGVPLANRDASTRAAIAELGDRVDGELVTRIWEDSLAAPEHAGPPQWIHGDLLAGNLLCHDGRLCAVIDWGAIGVADPAADIAPAWSLFDTSGRAAYRRALGCTDDEWRRGRGWALSTSLIALPYYWDTFQTYRDGSQRTIAAVIEDFGS
ncbi:aminoglycoside phosphotransferase family protein [Nocardioides sp. LS1]|uniref:aminoglycoside phosphotransferase family protein n=1 Tax=Nocardioides sp. LS1 TaxID=1027620 RepID=UPI000F618E80|nr:aminoglycoside phosphotransferase family protein [Nocardioides sp. LS1]GCD89007.1 hypothetical protein NLS1_10130 [Nocardioides sp. LS1]